MATRYGKRIVTDGLVLCLDAADNISAPHNDLPVKQGLVGWWDANDDSTVTLSGSNVTQWRDKSGNSNHMSVPSSYSGPTRGNTLNSKKVLTFTQSNGLESTLNLSSSNYTVFGVSRYTATGQNPSTSPSSGRVIQANSNNWLLGHHNAGTQRHYAVGWVTSAGTDDTNWRIYSGTGDISGDVYKFYVVGTDNTQNSGAGSAGPNGLGINTGYAEHSACEGAEIIAFNRVLSDDERTKVHNYLQNKWNIEVSDSKWYDRTANAYNGTPTNGPTYSETNKGYFDFDGTDQYINCGSTAGNFGTDPFTVSIWLKFDAITSFFNKRAADQDQILFSYSSGKPYFIYNAPNGTDYGYRISNTSLATGTWYNLVATVDRVSNYPVIYVNGANDGSSLQSSAGSPTTANMDNGGNLLIGTNTYANTTFYFNGQMSQVLLYKNKALSAAEVLQNYNATKGRYL